MRWNAFPYIRYCGAICCGILFYSLFPIQNILYTFPILGVLSGTYAILFRNSLWLTGIPALLILVVFGWLTARLHDEKWQPNHIVSIHQPIQAYEAVLSSMVETKTNTFRMTAEVRQIRLKNGWQRASGKILFFIDRDVPQKPHYGDVLLIKKNPEQVEPPYNPDEFNYQQYLRYQSIYFQQYLHPADFRIVGNQPPSILMAIAVQINERATSILAESLPSRNEYGVAAAMLLGVRDEIDSDLLRSYSAAGAIHTLSVSGMHVGILFLVLSWLLKPLGRKKGLFVFFVLVFLWGYALLTGLSAPVLRSAIMLSIFVIGDTYRISRNTYNTLAFSAFLILLVSPFTLFQMGFQLSYLSVAGILVLYPKLLWCWEPENPVLTELWSMSCGAMAAQLFTFPLAIYYFHQFPTYFLIVNPFVLGLSSLGLIVGMIYLVLSWIPILNSFLLYTVKLSFGLLNQLILQTEHWPGALWEHLYFSGYQVIILYGILFAAFLLWSTRQKVYLWGMVLFAMVLLITKLVDLKEHRQQQELVIHHLKKHTAISLIAGRTLSFWADPLVYQDKRTQALHLESFWTKSGILQRSIPKYQTFSMGKLISWQGKVLLWLDHPVPRKHKLALSPEIDVLLLTNNVIRSPEWMLATCKAKQVVLDVTNSKTMAKRWQEYCKERQIPFYDIRKQGAYQLSW
ncbi:MAG: ComEC/Rec2 family competence protein [Siphonobacter sp.]